MMKFAYISDRVSQVVTKVCQDKISSIFLELGTREDNTHVGTGMGGNLSQLLCLLDKRHILSGDHKNIIRVDQNNREVIWGSQWVHRSKRIDIRNKLNEIFASIPTNYRSNSDCNIANAICEKLAFELDTGNTSNVDSTGRMLATFPLEVVLISIRRFIQIDRLVKYNLDEHPAWCNLLNIVNRGVNGE